MNPVCVFGRDPRARRSIVAVSAERKAVAFGNAAALTERTVGGVQDIDGTLPDGKMLHFRFEAASSKAPLS